MNRVVVVWSHWKGGRPYPGDVTTLIAGKQPARVEKFTVGPPTPEFVGGETIIVEEYRFRCDVRAIQVAKRLSKHPAVYVAWPLLGRAREGG